ncbi:unnamed protein product [Heligmosomoides polygyrus]|uniref:PHM7_cyt domain-containing protein n=1 Tax=Heligmosomoides polygyrus TaxID=6339 RepID=A0A3P7XBA2_HELPZ|nr:unnamed protein product [Heligmosomoides polygyrus]
MTKPGRRKIEKQTWLWTDDVKEKVKEKKRLYHAFLSDKTADNWRIYQEAKRAARKAVAVAKASHYEDVNEKLDTRDGERQLYRLAKAQHRQSEDIEKFFGINDENGHLLMNRRRAMEQWHDYFERISTVESPSLEELTHKKNKTLEIRDRSLRTRCHYFCEGDGTLLSTLFTFGSISFVLISVIGLILGSIHEFQVRFLLILIESTTGGPCPCSLDH